MKRSDLSPSTCTVLVDLTVQEACSLQLPNFESLEAYAKNVSGVQALVSATADACQHGMSTVYVCLAAYEARMLAHAGMASAEPSETLKGACKKLQAAVWHKALGMLNDPCAFKTIEAHPCYNPHEYP